MAFGTHSDKTDSGIYHHQLSQSQKNANKHAYYKHWLHQHSIEQTGNQSVNRKAILKRNYDLVNGIVNYADYDHVQYPISKEQGRLPAKFQHRDIISDSVKRLVGIETSRPSNHKLTAINKDATTRKEEVEFGKLREYVLNFLKPQEQQAEEQPDPESVRKYMQRDYQDPVEVLGNQLLAETKQRTNLPYVYNKMWFHGIVSGLEVGWCGIVNGKATSMPVNSMYFKYDKSPDNPFIHKGQFGVAYYEMTTASIIARWGRDLSKAEIKQIHNENNASSSHDLDWSFENIGNIRESNENTTSVKHAVWKGVKKVGVLASINFETLELEEDIVNEHYKINEESGDIEIEWFWVSELHEAVQIGADIWVDMRPVPNQEFHIDTLGEEKDLPFIGVVYDDTNSEVVSIVDRVASYQFLYNIIIYRVELLMASDKGKKLLMNYHAIPESEGISVEAWSHFFEANHLAWYTFTEEGNKFGAKDVNQIAKMVDMSLASSIDQYIQIAEYIEAKAKKVIGITDQFEGVIKPREGQQNVQQSVAATNAALEPYFFLHEIVKKDMLSQLAEYSKYAAYKYKPDNLHYFTDDLGVVMLSPDFDLLENARYGIFMKDSSKDMEVRRYLQQYAEQAISTQTLELSSLGKFLQEGDLTQALEILEVGEASRKEFVQKQQEEAGKQAQELEAQRAANDEKKSVRDHDFKLEEIDREGEWAIKKSAVVGVGFAEDADANNNGVPDILETAKQMLEVQKFEYGKTKDLADRKQQELDRELKAKEVKQKSSIANKK